MPILMKKNCKVTLHYKLGTHSKQQLQPTPTKEPWSLITHPFLKQIIEKPTNHKCQLDVWGCLHANNTSIFAMVLSTTNKNWRQWKPTNCYPGRFLYLSSWIITPWSNRYQAAARSKWTSSLLYWHKATTAMQVQVLRC